MEKNGPFWTSEQPGDGDRTWQPKSAKDQRPLVNKQNILTFYVSGI